MSNVFSRFQPSSSARNAEAPQEYPHLVRILNKVIDACLYAAVFLIPLFFSSITLDLLELNKQTIFIVLAIVAFVAWLGKGVAEKSFTLMRSWLHLAVLLFGAGYLVVTLFSLDRYVSLAGALSQMPLSLSTVIAGVLFYFAGVHRIRSTEQVYNLLFTFLLSSFLVAVYGILQMLGIYIVPVDASHVKTFTSVGSIFSMSVFLTVPLIIASSLAYHGCRNNVCLLGSKGSLGLAARALVWGTIAASTIALLMVDYWVAWAALLFGTILTVVIGLLRTREISAKTKLILPAVLAVLSIALIIYRTPLTLDLPNEVSPSWSASADIAKSTLRDMPLFGSGPGTYIYDYAKYRVQGVNLSPFWNIRFDRSFSFFLTLAASAGIVGVSLWLLLVISAMVKSAGHLLSEKNEDVWFAYLTVFSGWATLVFASFFYNLGMTHVFSLWFLLMLLASLIEKNSITWNAKKSTTAFGILSAVFAVTVIAGVSSLWLTGQRFVADAYFSKAVADFRANKPAEEVIASIQKAHALNPMLDIYARNLSQAHLIKAANLIQANPNDQTAATQAQNEIKTAVDLALEASRISPSNVDNWANLGMIYESVASFTRGADEYAIANYKEASSREPLNPVFLNEIGKLYLLRADAYRTLINDADQAKRADAQKNISENLGLAEQSLKQSATAKPDYLPARYFLGVVYERQGRLKDSITELENALRINNKDLGIAFELSILYYRNNQKNEALDLMRQVVQADSSNVNARWYLSAMFEERGLIDDALQTLEPLAQQYKDNASVQQRYNALKARKTTKTLPEPIPEQVKSPEVNNPVSR